MNFFIFLLLLLLSTAGHMATDIYLPSLPAISNDFGIPNDGVQMSITFFTIGIAINQIFYGAFSDKYGRTKSLMLGLIISLLGTFICIISKNIYWLNFGRLIQGLGFGVSAAIPRTIMSDIFHGNTERAKYGSYMSMSVPVILSFAPILGSYIQTIFSWRAIFVFIFIYTLFLLTMVIFKLPESNLTPNPHALKISHLYSNIKKTISNRNFIGCNICSFVALGGIMAYLTASPFLLQDIVGLSPVQYAWLAAIIGLTIVIGSFSNSKLVFKFGIKKLLALGAVFMLLSGVIMISFSIFNIISVTSIMLPTVTFFFGVSFTFANSMAGAITEIPKSRLGIACAIFGTIQVLGGATSSSIIAVLPETSQTPLSCVYLICGLISILSTIFIVKLSKDITVNKLPIYKEKLKKI